MRRIPEQLYEACCNDPFVYRAMMRYRDGECSLEQALIDAVNAMVVVNGRLRQQVEGMLKNGGVTFVIPNIGGTND